MEKIGYMTRMARVMAQRTEAKQRKERRLLRRIGGVGMALMGAAACFFVLKAATLAHVGEARFEGGMAAADRSAGVQLWLRGIDPITRVLADVMVAAPTERMRTDG